jgi:L-threonylcarbamoyladenylate synthase
MPRVVSAYLASGAVDDRIIDEAAKLLRVGGLVAIPTETVYGLAANATDPVAVRRIFAAKGRPSFNPLIVHVSDIAGAKAVAGDWPSAADALAKAFWPGPLSIVIPRGASIPDEVTAGLGSVALRAPAHPVARTLLERSGLALAAPSANRSNGVSPTRAEHVVASLGDAVDLVLDGGGCEVGIESTVVDVTVSPPVILRPGGISAEALAEIIGPLGVASEGGAGPRASPGMLPRHYAPDAVTTIFAPSALRATLESLPPAARIVGVTVNVERPDDRRIVAWEMLGENPPGYARDLYAALHQADRTGATRVLIQEVPSSAEWTAIRDRIRRASATGW